MSAAPAAKRSRILVVDDDPIIADSLVKFLQEEGYACTVALDGREAIEAMQKATDPFNIVLTDVSMPRVSGMELLEDIRKNHPSTVAVMLTGYGTIESAMSSIRLGAFDFLSKPIIDSELRLAIERALRQQSLLAENQQLRRQLDRRAGLGAIIGSDHRMLRAMDMVNAVAPSKATVLMTGESGTGKSMIARTIHQSSPRAKAPFVEIHCGSIPETLLESELFGHVKGAFTGADSDKTGRFLAADTGTIFIDEINSASPAMQMKLLRILQERQFEPVGSTKTIEVDVRVILASNQPLEPLVREGAFREDLYYRINVVRIELPPLRDRPTDIPDLVAHFLERFSAEHGRTVIGVAPDAMAAIQRYQMPGNVRELANIVERAIVLSQRPTIELSDLPPHVIDPTSSGSLSPEFVRAGLATDDAVDAPDTPWVPTPLDEALREPERRILLKALRANDWNRQSTADQLAINRTTLYKKMKQFGLDRLAG